MPAPGFTHCVDCGNIDSPQPLILQSDACKARETVSLEECVPCHAQRFWKEGGVGEGVQEGWLLMMPWRRVYHEKRTKKKKKINHAIEGEFVDRPSAPHLYAGYASSHSAKPSVNCKQTGMHAYGKQPATRWPGRRAGSVVRCVRDGCMFSRRRVKKRAADVVSSCGERGRRGNAGRKGEYSRGWSA